MNNNDDRLHSMLVSRADAEATKRIRDKQKRFGQLHDIDQDLAERARVATLNRNAIIDLMGQHKILIPARELPAWRPTLPSKGDVNGIQDAITIIATNGILGWFLTHDGATWCGHIHCFSGDIKPLFSLPKPDKKTKPKVKKPKQKSKRQQIIDNL